jgi:PIN domain nuclease of toxin-antitoxin system
MAVALPEHHSDPQDRIIIAMALTHDAKLMLSDRKFPIYAELADRLL